MFHRSVMSKRQISFSFCAKLSLKSSLKLGTEQQYSMATSSNDWLMYLIYDTSRTVGMLEDGSRFSGVNEFVLSARWCRWMPGERLASICCICAKFSCVTHFETTASCESICLDPTCRLSGSSIKHLAFLDDSPL